MNCSGGHQEEGQRAEVVWRFQTVLFVNPKTIHTQASNFEFAQRPLFEAWTNLACSAVSCFAFSASLVCQEG